MVVQPNSLANLKPPWQPGERVPGAGNPRPGPKISPALHKYLDMSFEEIMAIGADQAQLDKLPMKDVIAISAILKAAKDQQWGDEMRKWIADRTEPRQPTARDTGVEVDVGIVVQLRWHNGDEVEL